MDPRQRVPLASTSLRVTQLSLGTAPIGGLYAEVGDQRAQAAIDRAWEHGIRFFDTAPLYGRGLSERRLGAALRRYPRDEYVLATKVGRLLRPEGAPHRGERDVGDEVFAEGTPLDPVFDFSRDGVMRSLEESLGRLGLDRVDVLHIHDPDEHFEQAMTEAYPTLDQLRSEGVIGALGAGMNQAEMLTRFAREADFDCFLVAGRYTLLDQAALPELLPACVERDVSVIIGGVYNSGILTNPVPGAHFNYKPAAPEWVERARRLQAVCDRHDTPLMAAAIQFPLAHPAVATVLTGVRSAEELDENERMARHPVPADLWAELRAEGLLPPEAPVPG